MQPAGNFAAGRVLARCRLEFVYRRDARRRYCTLHPVCDGRAPHARHLFLLQDAETAPVIVFFYGGSWQSGNKSIYKFVGSALARRGYVLVVPDYRVYPEVIYPAFLEDGALAVRWTKDNATLFGADPNMLFVMGHSAGAYMAAMLALDSRWLGRAGLSPRRDIAGLVGILRPMRFFPVVARLYTKDNFRRRTRHHDPTDYPC